MVHITEILKEARFDAQRAEELGVGSNARSWVASRKTAETLLFKAFTTCHDMQHSTLMQYWWHSLDARAKIFREASNMEMQPTARSYVRGNAQETSRGFCIGVSKGRILLPYCNIPHQAKTLIEIILADIKKAAPGFCFTSIQINVDLAAKPHVDGGNVGPSAIISLGPHTGGFLWTLDASGSVAHNPYDNWIVADGRVPHGNLPFYGQRVSCVAFTHAAIKNENVQNALHMASNAGFPIPFQRGPADIDPSLIKYTNLLPMQVQNLYENFCLEILEVADSVKIPKTSTEAPDHESATRIAVAYPARGPVAGILIVLIYAALLLTSANGQNVSAPSHATDKAVIIRQRAAHPLQQFVFARHESSCIGEVAPILEQPLLQRDDQYQQQQQQYQQQQPHPQMQQQGTHLMQRQQWQQQQYRQQQQQQYQHCHDFICGAGTEGNIYRQTCKPHTVHGWHPAASCSPVAAMEHVQTSVEDMPPYLVDEDSSSESGAESESDVEEDSTALADILADSDDDDDDDDDDVTVFLQAVASRDHLDDRPKAQGEVHVPDNLARTPHHERTNGSTAAHVDSTSEATASNLQAEASLEYLDDRPKAQGEVHAPDILARTPLQERTSNGTAASGDMVVTEMERRVTHVENIDDVVAGLEDGTGVLYEPPVNSNNSVVIGDSQAVDTLTSWWMPSPIMDFAHLTLKQVTIDALSKCKFGVPLHPKRLEIHTDGSTSDGPAAWANIFLLEDQEGSMWYAGYRTGMVVTDQEDDGCIGAARHTSSCAELSGIVWALKHAIQHGSFLPRADIFFDSEYAGDIAQAHSNPKANGEISKIAAGLALLAGQIIDVRWQHENGHANLPWNEFADVAAKWAARNQEMVQQTPSPCSKWVGKDNTLSKWAFLHRPTSKQRIEYSLQEHGSKLRLMVNVDAAPAAQVPSAVIAAKYDDFIQAEVTSSTPVAISNMRIFHFNPSTLRCEVKMKSFAEQMHKEAAIVGTFPEARHKHTGIVTKNGFAVATSACKPNGSGGCAIWLNLKKPVTTINGVPVCLSEDDISIIVAQPRRLVVSVTSPAMQCIIVCLHCLDTSYPEDERKEWWCTTASVLGPIISTKDSVILNIDGNTRVNHTDSGAAGDLLDDPHSDQPDFLTDMCKHFRLTIANTYSHVVLPGSELGTWHSPSGTIVRCDYMCFSQDFHLKKHSCTTSRTFCTGDSAKDHIPMHVDVAVQCLDCKAITKRRVAKYDRREIEAAISSTDPEAIAKKQAVESCIENLAPIPYTLDATSHIHCKDTDIMDIIVDFYPKKTERSENVMAITKHHAAVQKKGMDLEKAGYDRGKEAESTSLVHVQVLGISCKARVQTILAFCKGPSQQAVIESDLGHFAATQKGAPRLLPCKRPRLLENGEQQI